MNVRWMGMCFVLVSVTGRVCLAQTTRPAAATQAAQAMTSAALEIRASQAFSRGEYAVALPLLQKVAAMYQDQPQRLGMIQEQIRVCQKQLPPPSLPSTNPANPATIQPPPTAEQRKVHLKPKEGEILSLSIKELGNFEYDEQIGGNIPADVKALNGATVRLSGFMIPSDAADTIREFALVPSLFACCFGQPPQIQHTILVHVPQGKALSYYPEDLVVEGKLTVQEKKDDGYVVSLFEVQATSVKAAAK